MMGVFRASSRALGQPVRERGAITHVLLFVVVSALAGVLVAGMALPFAGLLGMSAQSLTEEFENMPSKLPKLQPPERSRLIAADGTTIATFYDQNRVEVGLDQVAPVMRDAVLAIEDSRFYDHGPMDAQGTARALIRNNQAGGVSQGGSSITQQYVKQVLFQNAKTPAEQRKVTEESYGRKLQELRYAVELEKNVMTKDEILEAYLNIVYFGDGAYGIESAARHYFDVKASELSLRQSAMLAGLVRDPIGLDPEDEAEEVIDRRNLVLQRMYDTGMVPEEKARKAMETGLGLNVSKTLNGCMNSDSPFFCQYAEEMLLNDDALGDTEEERHQLLYQGGLTIRTTLDRKAQKAAEKAIGKSVYATDDAVGAISLVEPGTGHIKAMAQSRPMGPKKGKGETFVNYNVGQANSGGLGVQPGSTFKTFVLAAAIKQGLSLNTSIPSPPEDSFPMSISTCKGAHNLDAPAPVYNSTSAGATSTLITGTTRSVNTFFVNLSEQTGLCEPATLAKKAGVKRGDGAPLEQVQSFVLGVNNVTPLSMAEAYATFAARGKHCRATPLVGVLDREGNKLPIKGPNCKQVMEKRVADGVNYVLKEVIYGGDPSRTGQAMAMNGDRPAAGKTGTNNSRISVSFAGYTPDLAGFAVVTDAHSTLKSLIGQEVGGRLLGENDVWGGAFSGEHIWLPAMEGALKGVPIRGFTQPDPDKLAGVMVDVPWVVGMSQGQAIETLESQGFNVTIGEWVDSELAKGTVAEQSPSGQAGSGSTITINLSDGTPPQPPQKPDDCKTPGPFPPPDDCPPGDWPGPDGPDDDGDGPPGPDDGEGN